MPSRHWPGTLSLAALLFLSLGAVPAAQAQTFDLVAIHPDAASEPSSSVAHVLSELEAFNGKLYAGYGDYDKNTGPTYVRSFDPQTGEFGPREAEPDTEAIYQIRVLGGKLYAPQSDPEAGYPTDQGYGYGEVQPDGSVSFATRTPVRGAHVWDAATFNGTLGEKLYGDVIGGQLGLAASIGPNAPLDHSSYSVGFGGGYISFMAFKTNGDFQGRYRAQIQDDYNGFDGMDLAAYDGIAVASLTKSDELLFVDMTQSNVAVGTASVAAPRGMTVDSQGRLYVVTQGQVNRYDNVNWQTGSLGSATALVTTNLTDPQKITVGPNGNIYVSDWGTNQVKVFNASGVFQMAIGTANTSTQTGLYDETQMCRPNGVAVDGGGRLWVSESNRGPKRISVWDTSTGGFSHGYYGPPRYGGGGELDPRDETVFFYPSNLFGVEYEIDWQTGESKPRAIYGHEADYGRVPGFPVYINDQLYLTSTKNGDSYFQDTDVSIYKYDKQTGTAQFVAWIAWPVDEFRELLEEHAANDPLLQQKLDNEIMLGSNSKGRFAIWSDLNLDGIPQGAEVSGLCMNRDDGHNPDPVQVRTEADFGILTNLGYYIPAPTMNSNGVPVWDLSQAVLEADVYQHLASFTRTPDGFSVFDGGYNGDRTLKAYKNGDVVWQYHATSGVEYEVRSPFPEHPGELILTARFLNHAVVPTGGEAGPIMALNTILGPIHLFTSDGLYITDISADSRLASPIRFPEAIPGTIVDDLSFGQEDFWPAFFQMADGTIRVAGGPEVGGGIFEVLHLGSVDRLESQTLQVTAGMLAGKPAELVTPPARNTFEKTEAAQPASAPVLDGDLSDWAQAEWETISDQRNMEGAVQVHGDRLYVAWKTDDPELMTNSVTASGNWETAFALGGGLDLMIRSNANAERPERGAHDYSNVDTAIDGDQRIFITRVGDPITGDLLAVRYQQVGTGGLPGGQSYDYISPIGEVHFDDIERVTSEIGFGQSGGNYELSVPLSLLGVDLSDANVSILGDIGVLLGEPGSTNVRYYWNNRAVTNVSDLPSEARLQPHEWGSIAFIKDQPAGAVGESGEVTITQSSSSYWQTVNLQRSYTDPVVVMGPVTNNDGEPLTVRVRNIQSSSFEFQIDEWDLQDGVHGQESVSYLVVEEGRHTLADGTVVVAGDQLIDEPANNQPGTGWRTANFGNSFSEAPILLAQIGSANEPNEAVAVQIRDVTAESAEIHMVEEDNGPHAYETIGWIAIERGTGASSGTLFEAGTIGGVTDASASGTFEQSFGATPSLFAMVQTMNEDDPFVVRRTSLDLSGFDIFLDEEENRDSETTHAEELLGYFALAPGMLDSN